MRLGADAYRPDRSTCGVDGVDDVVVAAGDPQQLAVGADVSHVGAAAARDRPRRLDFAGPEIEHRHASFAVRRSVDLVRTAVGDVELLAVAARIQAVCADAGGDELDFGEVFAVHDEHAVGHHVRNIEELAVGRDADILRHASLGKLQVAEHLAVDRVDLDQAALEFAGENRVTAVDCEVRVIDAITLRRGQRRLQRHRLRIAEVEPLERFRNHDRRAAVGREVHVVGIIHGFRLAWLTGLGVDRSQRAVGATLRVIGDPERAQVPGRHDVLRIDADPETVDDFECRRVDDVYVVRFEVRHVHALQRAADRCAHPSTGGFAVKIVGVDHRWHA